MARDCYFGGTFDPVHAGHMAIAAAALRLPEIQRVVFLPAPDPPHKGGRRVRPFEERVRLLELAAAGDPRLAVSRLEQELPRPSYTARTLEALAERGEVPPIPLLAGADTLLDLPHWYHPERVVALARFLVAPRPGVEPEAVWEALAPLLSGGRYGERITWLPMEPVACSATEIRRLLARGLDPGGLLPEPVRAHLLGRPPREAG
ncbi:MAG: nicotinate (nicotinamide) nucleotide adenylyltransferase [Nitrospirae bacterium]|nr:MAG: nicotinate (nicotinamide) nucleotide adenylyltransferase [Nitrospirota bacterium]